MDFDRIKFVARVKSLFRTAPTGPTPLPSDPKAALAQRLERTRLQMNVYREIAARLGGLKNEFGLSYYSYLAETPVKGGGTRLVRVEHIVFTNMDAHRMMTFVSNLDRPVEPYTEVSLVRK